MSEPNEVLHRLELVDNTGDRPDIDASVAVHQAATELFLGRLDDAERHVEEAEAHAHAANSPALQLHCLGARCVLSTFTGRFDTALSTARAATTLATTHDLAASDTVQVIRAHAAYAATLRLEPLPDCGSPTWTALAPSSIPALSETVRIVDALVDTTPAPGRTAELLRPRFTPEGDPFPNHLTALLAAETQHLFLAAGNIVDATNYAAFVHRKLGECAETTLLGAMVERFHGRLALAHTALVPVLDGSLPATHSITPLWAWIEEAALTVARGNDPSFTALRHALSLAEPQKLLRPFTRSSSAVRAVLVRNRGRFGDLNEFAESISRAVRPENDTSLVTLSPREKELLRELPSFRTAEAIAADNFISVNTVKTHLRGIYRKLGVTNRRDAIAAAHTLGLI